MTVRQSATGRSATGQWFTGGDGHRWWFDSGSVALDFAHSGGLGARPEWETLRAPSDLATWISDHLGVEVRVTRADLAGALTLRGAVVALVVGRGDDEDAANAATVAGDEAAAVIDAAAGRPDIPPRLGAPASTGITAAQALSTVARDAIASLGPDAPGVLRECEADDCTLVHLDSSRSRSRRWCSMQRCGNRAKVRAHRSRGRTNDPTDAQPSRS